MLGYEANIELIYYGPKWSWAEMVMGRNGHGPKWLWAEMIRIHFIRANETRSNWSPAATVSLPSVNVIAREPHDAIRHIVKTSNKIISFVPSKLALKQNKSIQCHALIVEYMLAIFPLI